MQFSIIAVLSMALAASASPIIEERTAPTGPVTAQQCAQSGSKIACCNNAPAGNVLPISLTCNPILNIINLLTTTCKSNQALQCCQQNGNTQTGLVNFNGCVPIALGL